MKRKSKRNLSLKTKTNSKFKKKHKTKKSKKKVSAPNGKNPLNTFLIKSKVSTRSTASKTNPTNVATNKTEQNPFMKKAIDLSREHMRLGHGGPFGAVIVKNGEIIAEGWNQVLGQQDPTAHAEISAIRVASQKLKNFDLSGCEIYSSCEPCPMCLAAIYWSRIDKLYYANNRYEAAAIGFDDEFFYKELAKPEQQRQLKSEFCPSQEAQGVFEEWKLKPDKISY